MYYFNFVEKMGNFNFVPVKIVIDYKNLLNFKSFVVYFDFVSMGSSEYSFYKILLFMIYLHSYNYVLRNYFYVIFV